MSSNQNAPHRDTVETRQGTTRPKLIYVLGAGLVLVLIVFGAIWGFQTPS